MVRVAPTLGGYGVALARAGIACVNATVLEYCGGIAKYEVYCTINVTSLVELSLGMHVKRVLVPFEAALVEDREVGIDPEGHGLAVSCSGRVSDCDALSNEPVSDHR